MIRGKITIVSSELKNSKLRSSKKTNYLPGTRIASILMLPLKRTLFINCLPRVKNTIIEAMITSTHILWYQMKMTMAMAMRMGQDVDMKSLLT